MVARSRNILVAYDGTDVGRRALDTAADLAGYGSTLAVVSVANGDGVDATAVLADARDRLQRRHVSARYVREAGEPAGEVLDAARRLGSDLIVVGQQKPAPGSVSRRIVRLAACDVLVVR